MKAIFNHFNSLGGLYNVSQENLLDTRIFNDEIKLIEEYLKRDIPKLLWNILKKYQGPVKILLQKDYELAEEATGKHSGILKGKFIYTFMWNKKTEKIDKAGSRIGKIVKSIRCNRNTVDHYAYGKFSCKQ